MNLADEIVDWMWRLTEVGKIVTTRQIIDRYEQTRIKYMVCANCRHHWHGRFACAHDKSDASELIRYPESWGCSYFEE